MRASAVTDVPLAEWRGTVAGLRDAGYDYFDWLSAVDQLDAGGEAVAGFDLVCHLVRAGGAGDAPVESVLVRARVPEGSAAPSLTAVFRGAAWHERETHEMFGIDFDGFDDGSGLGLRPLLLPEGFEGTPLRKSFQLAARASKPWPGGKEPGEGHAERHGEAQRSGAPSRRRVQAPGVPPPEWGPR